MKRSISPVASLRPLLAKLESQKADMVKMLRALVEHESPSDDKASCDRLAESLAAEFSKIGGHTRLFLNKKVGNHLQVDFAGSSGKPVLVVGHFDTVYGLGTLKTMPYRETTERVSGPGALDMKGGIVQVYFALGRPTSRGSAIAASDGGARLGRRDGQSELTRPHRALGKEGRRRAGV